MSLMPLLYKTPPAPPHPKDMKTALLYNIFIAFNHFAPNRVA